MSVETIHIPSYVPEYQSPGSAGLDIKADIPEAITLQPLQRYLISTGLRIALPENMEAQIRPRSGLASRRGITVINSPGTIDSDYRGEIKIPIVNLSNEEAIIEPGERIAQMVIAPYIQIELNLCSFDELSKTERGSGGFGSTGEK
ncbi:MAG: dUTP diphosphatase [Spirochaetaceae bacterium]|nr:MAG: dUTP diphosphatase [Spirochaetaceae bacterium]